jgi:hypothetical protein
MGGLGSFTRVLLLKRTRHVETTILKDSSSSQKIAHDLPMCTVEGKGIPNGTKVESSDYESTTYFVIGAEL